jgi:GTP cyclohydrolase II
MTAVDLTGHLLCTTSRIALALQLMSSLSAMPEDSKSPSAAAPSRVVVRRRIALPISRAGGATPDLVTFNGLPRPDDFALVFGGPLAAVPWVRVHSACLTGDLFGSARCDCGPQLDAALAHLAGHGGVLVYLHQEGRGIGLRAKIEAYALQDQGLDTFAANESLGFPPDARDYESAAAMLAALGIARIRLLTGNPEKIAQLRRAGIEVESSQPIDIAPTDVNREYLEAKRQRFASFTAALAKRQCD